MNEFILSGVSMGQPEVKQTEAGLNVAELVLKVKRSFKGKGGTQEEEIVRVNMFGKLTEESNDISCGDVLLVKGHIYPNNTNKDGKQYYFSNIVADRIEKII